MKPIIFVILDGAADSGSRTPLSDAKKKIMDSLAGKSFCGVWMGAKAPKGYNPKSMSDVATLELLGYSFKDNPGRGYLEALGIGMKISPSDVCLRGNFASAERKGKKFLIKDRRAGRDETGLEKLSKKLNMKIMGAGVRCIHSVGHRCVVVVKGKNLGINITDSDSKNGYMEIRGNDKKSRKTAMILNEFSGRAFEILSRDTINKKRKVPANFILLRGASKKKSVASFRKKFGLRACSVSGVGIIKGISKYLGIEIIEVSGATGHLNTNLLSKLNAALLASKKYDFVILHINGCDEAGHDKNFAEKKNFIEKIDRIVFSRLTKKDLNLAISSDHQTSVITGSHQFGSVPFIIFSPDKKLSNGIAKFSEKACEKGYFSKNFMKTVLSKLSS